MNQLIIVIGTKNAHKVKEILSIRRLTPGAKPSVKFIPLTKFPAISPVKENGQTYLANAIKKAKAWAKETGYITLAEDSGIEVKALGWKPGIYSARYASMDGKNAPHKDNNTKMLAELAGLPPSKRIARYQCFAVLAAPDGRILARTRGVCRGKIALAPAGKNGFGYDPIFIPDGYTKTLGQLPAKVKHTISHRAQALRAMFRKI